jgi:hypothetical protein
LPDNYITAKRKLREDYNPKVLELNDEILKIKQEIGDLKVGLIETGVDVGPAIYLARVFKTDIDTVVKFFIFILIFVFDPMAVSLIIAYNRVLEDEDIKLKQKKINVKKPVTVIKKAVTPKAKPIPDPEVIEELEEKVLTKDIGIGKGGRIGR